MARRKLMKEFEPGRGYTREDWDAVDLPELTDEQLASARPLREVLPELWEAIQRDKAEKAARGEAEPPPTARVTLRLDADVLAKFRATGPGWQRRVNAILRAADPAAPPAGE
jgi:uncharacterized protein (DUF4415 family)